MTGAHHYTEEEIRAAVSPRQAVRAIEAALEAGFDPASDPARGIHDTSQGQLLLMPSEVGRFAGVKVATVAPRNPAAGLPRIQGSYLLFDADTLTLQATLDGTALTTLRTPAVSVAAIRLALSRITEPARVVVFGGGPQATGHVATLAAVLDQPLAGATFVVRHPDRVHPSVRDRGDVVRAGSAEAAAALSEAHVIVCATSARTPLFDAGAIRQDAIVVAVGSHEPTARELDPALLARSQVIVEDRDTALREAGDVILPIAEGVLDPASLITLSDAVTGKASFADDRSLVFKSVGMAWEDLVVAAAVLAT